MIIVTKGSRGGTIDRMNEWPNLDQYKQQLIRDHGPGVYYLKNYTTTPKGPKITGKTRQIIISNSEATGPVQNLNGHPAPVIVTESAMNRGDAFAEIDRVISMAEKFMGERLAVIQQKLAALDQLETRIDNRFKILEARIEEIEADLDAEPEENSLGSVLSGLAPVIAQALGAKMPAGGDIGFNPVGGGGHNAGT